MPGHETLYLRTDAVPGTITIPLGVGTYAGTPGTAGYADGRFFLPPGTTAASFVGPLSVSFDGSGNLFVLDGDGMIRKITASGIVSTVADFSSYPSGGATPVGMARVPTGDFYVTADTSEVVRFTPQGVGSHFANTASNASGIAVDGSGRVYVADVNYSEVRVFDSSGSNIQTFDITPAGPASYIALDNSGYLYTSSADGSVWQFTSTSSTDGTVIWGGLGSGSIGGLTVDGSDNVYVSAGSKITILPATTFAPVKTLAGTGSLGHSDGRSDLAMFSFPSGLAFDASGNLYVADQGNNRIRKVSADGKWVSTFAGTPDPGHKDGWAVTAQFNVPQGVGADASGNIYVADTGNNVIRKLGTDGYASTVPMPIGALAAPTDVVADTLGNLYVNDTGPGHAHIVKIAGGVVTEIWPYLSEVRGLAVDSANNLYVADFDGSPSEVHVFAPSGAELTPLSGFPDGPYYLAIDSSDTVFVSLGNNNIYKSTSPTTVSQVAITQRFYGLAWDPAGYLLGSDRDANQIVKIALNGQTSVLAGTGSIGKTDGPPSLATFSAQCGIVFHSGVSFVADTGNSTIRTIKLAQ